MLNVRLGCRHPPLAHDHSLPRACMHMAFEFEDDFFLGILIFDFLNMPELKGAFINSSKSLIESLLMLGAVLETSCKNICGLVRVAIYHCENTAGDVCGMMDSPIILQISCSHVCPASRLYYLHTNPHLPCHGIC